MLGASAIIQAIASILAYFAIRGIDQILGKWAAYVTIAWEKAASQKALEEFRNTKKALIEEMPDKWKEWDEWRRKTLTP